MRVRYKDLSLQQIKTFREVCRRGSYSEVARKLRLSPSAVWEQIRGLERFFDMPLLEARNGRVRATAEGKQLLSMLTPALGQLESVREVLHQLRGRPPESITLVSGMRMLSEEVAPAVTDFRRRFPDVRVRLFYAQDKNIDGLIERGEADFGLSLDRKIDPSSPGVVHEFGYELDFFLAAPPRHPLLKKRPFRLADLVRYPLIVGAEGTATRASIDHVLHRHGLAERATIAVETNSSAITFACVRARAGIGVTAGPLQGALTAGLGVRSLRHWFGRARYIFIWGHGKQVLPVQRQFADLIRAHATGQSR